MKCRERGVTKITLSWFFLIGSFIGLIFVNVLGTRLYTGPEWFLHNIYLGKEAAVWSLGVLLYNMVNGRLPFQNEKHICTAHLLGPLPFYAEISECKFAFIAFSVD